MGMKGLSELPRIYQGITFHAFLGHVVATCTCGNKEPIMIPYMQGLDFWVTCAECRRNYAIISIRWERGMKHPDVRISMKEPEILPARISVAQS